MSPQRSQVRLSKGVVHGAAVPHSGTKSSTISHPLLYGVLWLLPPSCSLLPLATLRHRTLPDHSHLHSSLFSSPSKGRLLRDAPWPHSWKSFSTLTSSLPVSLSSYINLYKIHIHIPIHTIPEHNCLHKICFPIDCKFDEEREWWASSLTYEKSHCRQNISEGPSVYSALATLTLHSLNVASLNPPVLLGIK